MPIFQIPPVYLPMPENLFRREIRPGEASRYSVESRWSSANGQATYSYEMQLEAEKASPEKQPRLIVARLENLRAKLDEQELNRRLFGVIPFELAPTGPPQKLSAGGALDTYVFPMLAFTLPSLPPGPDGTFEISGFQIQGIGAVKISGRIIGFPKEGMELAYQITLGSGPSAPVMTMRSWYKPGRGQLLRAEGSYVESAGTLSFRLKKT